MTSSLTSVIKLIDDAMTKISHRDLVATNEMTDLLLDIRLHLTNTDAEMDLMVAEIQIAEPSLA